MRTINIRDLKEGMTLGRTLRTEGGSLVLSEGQALSSGYIKKIRSLGFNEVFVSTGPNDVTQEAINVISDSLKLKAVDSVRDFFKFSNQDDVIDAKFELLQERIVSIVESILSNKDLVYNLMDLKLFDDYTYHHSVNVAVISIVLGMNLGMCEEDLRKLGMSGLIHDIGKVFVVKNILTKESSLTGTEFTDMKEHVTKGLDFVASKLNLSKDVCDGLADHHEKWNGSGYPLGKIATQITMFGRIVAIADVYDALTSNRPYREKLSPSDAFEFIIAHSGIHFDPAIIEVFFSNIAPYPLGVEVMLSDGRVGIVVKNYKQFLLRPDVKIDGEVISLKNDKSLLNVTIVSNIQKTA